MKVEIAIAIEGNVTKEDHAWFILEHLAEIAKTLYPNNIDDIYLGLNMDPDEVSLMALPEPRPIASVA